MQIKLKFKKHLNGGYLLIEILIAMVIFSIIVGSVFPTLDFMLKRYRQINSDVTAKNYVMDGLEVSYNVFLADGNWSLADGIYKPDKTVDDKWMLTALDPLTDEWETLTGGYKRRVELIPLCRDAVSGEQKTCDVGDPIDQNSKWVKTTLQWVEGGTPKEISTTLTVYRF